MATQEIPQQGAVAALAHFRVSRQASDMLEDRAQVRGSHQFSSPQTPLCPAM